MPPKIDYKIWPSKIHFICSGRFICGSKKDTLNICVTFALLVYMVLSYIIFVYPMACELEQKCIPVLTLISIFFPFQQLFLIVTKDPGVIPRGNLEDPEKSSDNLTESTISTLKKPEEIVLTELGEEKKEGNILIENDGRPVSRFLKPRYCTTCKIIRPSRSSHCRHCDHCVQGFDHHCFWVGSCIGIRNWRNFIYFITACSVSAALSLFGCLLIVYSQLQPLQSIVDHIADNKEAFHIFLYSSIALGIFAFICRCHYSISFLAFIMFTFLIIWHSFNIIPFVTEFEISEHYYQNPIIQIFISLQFMICLFGVAPVTFTNWLNASQFKTTKEIDSEYRLNYKQVYKFNLKQNCQNLKRFVTYPIPESLIGY